MTVNKEINDIARRIKEEVNKEVDLSIGDVEQPAQVVPVLCERMDNVCAMMDYQSEMIKNAEDGLEEKKFQYKRKELAAKQTQNRAFVDFKQEDRPKPHNQRRTDKEYEAMSQLEASVELNEALTAEKDYVNAQHKLQDEKHKYEILNNHFLSYRKASDMLMAELKNLSGPRTYYDNNRQTKP